MCSLKSCKKMIVKSTTLFKVCCVLILISLILDLLCFCSDNWITSLKYSWSYGLWQFCVPDNVTGNQSSVTDGGVPTCYPISEYGVWVPNMSANATGMTPPAWFQALQTSEVFGLICLCISTIMGCTLLCYISNPRLEKVTVFVCGFAGVFIDIGLIIILWVFELNVYFLGYSFWVALVASVFCYASAVLLKIDLLHTTETNTVILHGESKRGIVIHVCGCSSTKTSATTPPESPAYGGDVGYSTWCQKPQQSQAEQQERPRSAMCDSVPEIEITHPLQNQTSRENNVSQDESPPPYSS